MPAEANACSRRAIRTCSPARSQRRSCNTSTPIWQWEICERSHGRESRRGDRLRPARSAAETHCSHNSSPARPPACNARAYLESVRAELAERHFAGASGSEIVAAMTAAMDDLLRALFRMRTRSTAAAPQAQPETRSRRARRLWTRRTESAFRRRSAVSARLQARSVCRDRHRNNPARVMGRRPHRRARRAHREGLRAARQRRFEGKDRDS